MQTRKLDCAVRILLHGSSYWKEIINFEALLRHGMISSEDLGLFEYVDDPATALTLVQAGLEPEAPAAVPDFAGSRCEVG